jgi:RNA polymerase sigma factor FliA
MVVWRADCLFIDEDAQRPSAATMATTRMTNPAAGWPCPAFLSARDDSPLRPAAGTPGWSTERERLLFAHLPQVRSIATRMRHRLPPPTSADDLYQAGVIGLIQAVGRYAAGEKAGFSSFAQLRIRGAMIDSLRESDWSPRNVRRFNRCLQKATTRLREKLGRQPDEFEAACAMRMSIEEYRSFARDLQGLRLESLDWNLLENSPGRAEPRDEGADPYQLCLRAEIDSILARSIRELNPQERRVLALYYAEERTMKEVGASLGIGESRVCQIHAAILEKLRARLGQKPAEVVRKGKTSADERGCAGRGGRIGRRETRRNLRTRSNFSAKRVRSRFP